MLIQEINFIFMCISYAICSLILTAIGMMLGGILCLLLQGKRKV
jgi:hypothetical protein